MSAPVLPTDRLRHNVAHRQISSPLWLHTLFHCHRSTWSHMLILCAALSALSSLRAILRPLYISIAPDSRGTAGSADKDVRQYATDRLALFMFRQGQEFIDIYIVHHGVLSHFSPSAGCLMPQQLAADMTVTFHMLINTDEYSVWLTGHWQAAMSTHERVGRRKLGHCKLGQRGQCKSEANKETRTLPQRRNLYVLAIRGINIYSSHW